MSDASIVSLPYSKINRGVLNLRSPVGSRAKRILNSKKPFSSAVVVKIGPFSKLS